MHEYITKDAALAALERASIVGSLNAARDNIMDIVAIDAAPVVHGLWIRQKGQTPEAICSCCGRDVVYQVIAGRRAFENFCPHCGGRMGGGDGHETI